MQWKQEGAVYSKWLLEITPGLPIRRGYVICRAPCKMEMQGFLFKTQRKSSIKGTKISRFSLSSAVCLNLPWCCLFVIQCCNPSGTEIPAEWVLSFWGNSPRAHRLPLHYCTDCPRPSSLRPKLWTPTRGGESGQTSPFSQAHHPPTHRPEEHCNLSVRMCEVYTWGWVRGVPYAVTLHDGATTSVSCPEMSWAPAPDPDLPLPGAEGSRSGVGRCREEEAKSWGS